MNGNTKPVAVSEEFVNGVKLFICCVRNLDQPHLLRAHAGGANSQSCASSWGGFVAEWRETTLGDVTLNFDSRRVPIKTTERKPGEYPYYGASGIVDRIDGYLFDGDYLLISEDGENLRSRSTPIAFLASGQFWVNNHAHVVQASAGNDTRFLSHLLAVTDIAPYLSGSAQPKLSRASMDKIAIRVPPEATQRAIAEVLGALDDKIAANTRLAAAAESLAVALVSALPLKSTLGALVTHRRTMVAPDSLADPVVEHFSLPSFDSGKHPELAAPSSIKSGKFAIEQPSVLISKLNPRIPRIWLTPTSTGVPQLASTEFLVLAPRTVDPAVLWALAMQPSFSAALEGKVAGTSGSHQRVTPGDMLDTPIGDPTGLSSNDRFEIVSLCATAQSARAENVNLAATRDALLPALMSGRLHVKDAEKVVADAV